MVTFATFQAEYVYSGNPQEQARSKKATRTISTSDLLRTANSQFNEHQLLVEDIIR